MKSGGLLDRVEDCWVKWRIVGESGGLLVNVEDCWIEWRIVLWRRRAPGDL